MKSIACCLFAFVLCLAFASPSDAFFRRARVNVNVVTGGGIAAAQVGIGRVGVGRVGVGVGRIGGVGFGAVRVNTFNTGIGTNALFVQQAFVPSATIVTGSSFIAQPAFIGGVGCGSCGGGVQQVGVGINSGFGLQRTVIRVR